MIAIFDDVAEQRRSGIDVIDHHIDVAIIEQIAKGRASRCNYIRQAASSCGRNFLKFGAVKIAKKLWSLRPCSAPILPVHFRVNMSVSDEDVEQAIVVEIEKARSPGQKRNGRRRPTRPDR